MGLPARIALAVGATVAFALRSAGAVTVDVENGVFKLEQSSFDKAIAKFPAVMVKFYAPWCGHCKELLPKYEKAAKKLKKVEGGPRLAKVDATVEQELSKKYEVSGYPTLLIFKNGELFGPYDGPREKNDIVDYMQSFGLPMGVDIAMRGYVTLRGLYKELVKLVVPVEFRKFARASFPALLAFPFVLLLVCVLGCCGQAGSSSSADKKAPVAADDTSSSKAAEQKTEAEAEQKDDKDKKEE